MADRVLFPLLGLLALVMIALALVWPQGMGARSPGPFGHAPVQQLKPAAAPKAVAAPPGAAVLGLAPLTPSSAPAAPPAAKPAANPATSKGPTP